jgi:hypothetical protein
MKAMGAMSIKGIAPERGSAALRQLLTKSMFSTPASMKAQEAAGIDFHEDVQKLGIIEALNRLNDALNAHGLTMKSALGVESNRGTIQAIEALLDKNTMARINAIEAGSAGAAGGGAATLKDTEAFRAKERSTRIDIETQGWGANIARNLGQLADGLLALGDTGADQRNEDSLQRTMARVAERPEEKYKALKEKIAMESERDINIAYTNEWTKMNKEIKETIKETIKFGEVTEKALMSAEASTQKLTDAWGAYIIKAKDALALNDEKQADRMMKRGADYSTRTATGTLIGTMHQMATSHAAAAAAGINGDLPRLEKESNRFQGFTGQLRGMDLATVGKKGLDWNAVEQYIEQQMDFQNTPRSERFKVRSDMRKEARGFERDVQKSYNRFSLRPDIHKDEDFGKWYGDKAADSQMKEEHSAEEASLEKAVGKQKELETIHRGIADDLRAQRDMNKANLDLETRRLAIATMLPFQRITAMGVLENDVQRASAMGYSGRGADNLLPWEKAGTKLTGPTNFSLGTGPKTAPTIVNNTDNKRVTIHINGHDWTDKEIAEAVLRAHDKGSVPVEVHK